MFLDNKNKLKIYEKEIKDLTKQVVDLSEKLQIANKYRDEYEALCAKYKKEFEELQESKRYTDELLKELQAIVKDLESKNK